MRLLRQPSHATLREMAPPTGLRACPSGPRPASPTVTATPHRAARLRTQAEASRSGSGASAAPAPATAPALTYTSYEGNAWRAELSASGTKFLVDPWLVGNLTFGGLDFIYSGSKRVTRPETIDIPALAAATDFILLTMAIDDHAHRPTLEALPKTLPVVGSPSAAAVARYLGYQTVYEVDHGQTVTLCEGRLTVTATAGALVGPPWSKRENGFVVKETVPGGVSLYYEPHADYAAASVAGVGTVDIVVSPPATQSLLGYALVKGATDNVPLLKMLRPKAVVALMNAEFDATGPLDALLSEKGGPQELERQLAAEPDLKGIKVLVPRAGEPLGVALLS